MPQRCDSGPAIRAGEHFAAVLGAQQSALEAVLLKRRVMGPSWLTLSCPTRVDTGAQVAALHHSHALHCTTVPSLRSELLSPMSILGDWQRTADL